MYPVSTIYKDKIQELNRDFRVDIVIHHSTGTLNLNNSDLVSNSLKYKESSQSGDDFTIGGVVASEISFDINKKPNYDSLKLVGATLEVDVELLLNEDTNYWETIPLGVFNIDEVDKLRNTVSIKAIDNMIKLDRPYSESNLSYPASLKSIYGDIHSIISPYPETLNFPNDGYIVSNKPDGEHSYRDILSYVAQLSGTFAKTTRSGDIELKWYTPTDIVIEPKNRFHLEVSDEEVNITGISFETEENIFVHKDSDNYIINISENPLFQDLGENLISNIYDNVKGITFVPYKSEWQGNPALECGDMIQQIDVDGNIYDTIVTNMEFTFRGKSTIEANGTAEIKRGYRGSTDKRISEIKRRTLDYIDDKISTVDEAILNATELITGVKGGYVYRNEGEILITDAPTLEDMDMNTKVWRWNLNGLGYSENGINGPYETAITMDGSINAKFITTGILNAEIVKTGLLETLPDSEGKTSWINMDTGEFNFKEAISYVNGEFQMMITDQFVTEVTNNISEFDDIANRLDSIEANMNFDYAQDTAPVNPEIGTVWFSTSNQVFIVDNLLMPVNDMLQPVYYYSVSLNRSYRWDGEHWLLVEDSAIGELRKEVIDVVMQSDQLSQKVTSLEYDADNLESRMNSAESKITSTAITNTVESNTTILVPRSELIQNYAEKSTVQQTSDALTLKFEDLKNLDNTRDDGIIDGGITKISKDGIKVTHLGSDQYSEMRADGFVRKWDYGEAKYLNDIFVASFSFGTGSSTSPFITDVLLPETMRDREIEIYLTLTSITNNYGQVIENGTLSDFTIMNQTDLEIDSRVGNLIKVNNSIKTQYRKAPNWNYVTEYTRAGFTLIAIGK